MAVRKKSPNAPGSPSTTAAVLTMYYKDNQTQRDISRRLNLSLPSVNRILAHARSQGLVKFTLTIPTHDELAGKLRGLIPSEVKNPEVIVLPLNLVSAAPPEPPDRRNELPGQRDYQLRLTAVGNETAAALEKHLVNGVTLSIDGGDSVAKTIESLSTVVYDLKLYPVAGGPSLSPLASLPSLIGRFLGKFGPAARLKAHLLPPPVDDASKAMAEDLEIAVTLRDASEADLFLLGVGSISADNGSKTAEDLLRSMKINKASLLSMGVVGVTGYSAFDRDGRAVASQFDQKVMKVRPEKILEAARSEKRRVFLCGIGPEKATALRGLIKGGWANSIITDQQTAEAVMLLD